MPGSVVQGKQEIKHWIASKKNIKTIIDVGAGSATYPKLLGKNYEYIAIEIFKPYIRKFQLRKYYKEIIIGDVTQIDLPQGDCIIFGDVLEHIDKEEALKLIEMASMLYPHIVISIPISHKKGEIRYAETHYGNIHESHISAWDFRELADLVNWEISLLINKNRIGIFMK